MKKIAATLAVVGLAATALAQPGSKTGMEVKVRPFGSSDPNAWTSSFTAQSPNLTDPIVLEVGVFYYRSTGFGLATVVHNIIGSPYDKTQGDLATIIDNTTGSTQHPDGRIGTGTTGFNNGGQLQQIYGNNTSGVDIGRFRIAASGNPTDLAAGGISIKQNNPVALGTDFITADGVFAYHFKLSLACYNNGAQRTITIDAPKTKVNSYRVYDTATSQTATDVLASLAATVPAVVNVSWAVPAPASLALLGLGGLVVGRRRR